MTYCEMMLLSFRENLIAMMFNVIDKKVFLFPSFSFSIKD